MGVGGYWYFQNHMAQAYLEEVLVHLSVAIGEGELAAELAAEMEAEGVPPKGAAVANRNQRYAEGVAAATVLVNIYTGSVVVPVTAADLLRHTRDFLEIIMDDASWMERQPRPEEMRSAIGELLGEVRELERASKRLRSKKSGKKA